MPRYLALIYGDASSWEVEFDPQEMAEYDEFSEAAGKVLVSGEALQAPATATTVRVQGGKGGEALVSDGPFAETKEVLGGYFVLDCADLDEAIAWAKQIPGAWRGSIEVRPVMDVGSD
jgi:hypothetical protein